MGPQSVYHYQYAQCSSSMDKDIRQSNINGSVRGVKTRPVNINMDKPPCKPPDREQEGY